MERDTEKRARKEIGADKKLAKVVSSEETKSEERAERWVPPSRNMWTNRPFSDRFFEILEKRKELPAWQAR